MKTHREYDDRWKDIDSRGINSGGEIKILLDE
jgi:hypothetical protein